MQLCVAQGNTWVDTCTIQWYQCRVRSELVSISPVRVLCRKEMWHKPTEAADRWDFECDTKQFLQWSQTCKLISLQLPFSLQPCTVCDTPLEVLHSGHVPLTVCFVRVSGETEAKCVASLTLQTSKSCDWHLPVVLPLGGIIQGCAACWAAAMCSKNYWSPPTGIYVFQTPSGDGNSAKKSCWMPCRKIQRPHIIHFFISLLPIRLIFFTELSLLGYFMVNIKTTHRNIETNDDVFIIDPWRQLLVINADS